MLVYSEQTQQIQFDSACYCFYLSANICLLSMSISVDSWAVYVQVFVLHQFMSLSWELMLAWEFFQQGNKNGVTYERDDQRLRDVEQNTRSEKLRTVNLFIFGTAAYYCNRAVLGMAHRQDAPRHMWTAHHQPLTEVCHWMSNFKCCTH